MYIRFTIISQPLSSGGDDENPDYHSCLGYCDSLSFSLCADTLTVEKLEDPARNRLLTISTGEVMLPGTVSFGIHEIFLGQVGFTTGEKLQWNASLMLIPVPVIGTGYGGSGVSFISYISAGTKWQFTQQRGGLGNMSLSSDLGTFLKAPKMCTHLCRLVVVWPFAEPRTILSGILKLMPDGRSSTRIRELFRTVRSPGYSK